MFGKILDPTKTLRKLKVTEIKVEEIDDLNLEVVSKVQSIDSAHIDNISEYVLNGYLLEGDKLELNTEKDKDFTIRRLKQILSQMRDPHTGLSVKNRWLRLRLHENCFVASEAVDWMVNHINLSRNEAIALGKGLEREGFIYHVNTTHNFEDSKDLYFRFTEDIRGKRLSTNFGNVKIATYDSIANQSQFHTSFWSTSISQSKVSKLASYVPNALLRNIINNDNPRPITPPFSEKYPAAVLFADISGFTNLAERLGNRGSDGIEILTFHLNNYFGAIINIIFNHGGDVVKFAGDALVAMWPTSDTRGLGYSTLLAAQCAMSLIKELNTYKVDDCSLTLHIGVGAGDIWGLVVGGVKDRMEFLIAGPPLDQVAECESAAQSGEVYISFEAVKLISSCVEVSVESGSKRKKCHVNSLKNFKIFKLESIIKELPLPTRIDLPHFKKMNSYIKPFIQPFVVKNHAHSLDRFLNEIRNVSVIFVKLDWTFKPSELDLLQKAVVIMQEAVYTYGGTIRQFIIDDKGSVLIAVFGLPGLTHEDDPLRAIQTSLKIHADLKELELESSIGVTTGKTFCGAVGSEERREYAMVGDIVNLSARLMYNADKDILCDHTTYNITNKRVEFKAHLPITVKGKSEPINIYTPVRMKRSMLKSKESRIMLLKAKNASLHLSFVTNKLIGKDDAHKILMENLEWLEQSNEKSRFILIEGESGIGKTFLTNFFIPFCDAKNIKTIKSTTYAIESSTAYYAWRDIFGSIFKVDANLCKSDDSKSFELKKKNILDVLKTAYPDSDVNEIASFLNNIFCVDFEETEKTKQLSGPMRAEKLDEILLKLLKIHNVQILVFDNAQWMDSASQRLLKMALNMIPNLLIIANTRTILSSSQLSVLIDLASKEDSVHIKLDPLKEDDIISLFSHQLKVKSVDKNVSDLIVNKSGGNPLIIVELADTLLIDDQITIVNERCMATQNLLQSNRIPDTIRALITSKIDRLTSNQKMILKVSSVIGNVFELNTLKGIMEGLRINIKNIEDEIETLISKQLISRHVQMENHFEFCQTLTQEVVYELMIHANRKELHKKIAEWYKSNSTENSVYTLLAYHYKKADDLNNAVLYYIKSGEQALINDANKEAVSFFTEALEIHKNTTKNSKKKSNKDDQWYVIPWKRQLGQAYYNLGLLDKAKQILDDALESLNLNLKSKTNDLLNRIKINKDHALDLKMIKSRGYRSSMHNVIENNVFNASTGSILKREAILILLKLGKINYFECRKDDLTYCNLMALKMAEDMGISKELCEAYGNAIITCSIHLKNNLAEEFITYGIEISNVIKSTDIEPLMNAYQMSAMHYISNAEWEKAEKCLNEVIQLTQESKNARQMEESYIHLSNCYYLQGKIKQSLEVGMHAVESAQMRGDMQSQILAYTSQARNEISLGKNDEADRTLKKIEKFIGQGGGYKMDFACEIIFHSLLAMKHLSENDLVLAYHTSETILKLLKRSQPTSYFTFYAYITMPIIYLTLLQRYSQFVKPKNITTQKIKDSLKESLNYLSDFSKTFSFAEPRYLLYKGIENFISGNNVKAMEFWKKSVNISDSKMMLYDKGIALFRIGKCTGVHDNNDAISDKIKAFDSAIEILTDIGAVYTELT